MNEDTMKRALLSFIAMRTLYVNMRDNCFDCGSSSVMPTGSHSPTTLENQ